MTNRDGHLKRLDDLCAQWESLRADGLGVTRVANAYQSALENPYAGDLAEAHDEREQWLQRLNEAIRNAIDAGVRRSTIERRLPYGFHLVEDGYGSFYAEGRNLGVTL